MQFQILLLAVGLGQGLSLNANQGCEVKASWIIDYMWNEIYISAWIPAGQEGVLLTTDIDFEGHINPVTYDSIEIHRDQLKVTRIREGKQTPESHKFLENLTDGWANFVLTVDNNYGFRSVEGNLLPPSNIPVDYLPSQIRVAGNNVTINCQSDFRFKKIWNGPSYLPLTKSERHWLTFFSYTEFSPRIVVEGREFVLGWNNGILTTIPTMAQPLPPFIEHHLMLNCREGQETICSVQIGDDKILAEELRVAKMPQSVVIMRKQPESFHVFLNEKDPFMYSPPETADLESKSKSTKATCKEQIALIIVGSICIVAIIVAVLVLWLRKHKKLHSGKRQRQPSTTETPETAALQSTKERTSSEESGIGSINEGVA